MDGTTNHLRVVLKRYQSSMAKRRTTLLNGDPNFVPVSASRTESYLTCYRGKSDRWKPATFRPPLVRRGMPPTRHTIIFDWRPSRLCRTEIRGHHTRRWTRAWTAGSAARAVQREFALSNSRGAFKSEQHANAFRPGPGRAGLHHE